MLSHVTRIACCMKMYEYEDINPCCMKMHEHEDIHAMLHEDA